MLPTSNRAKIARENEKSYNNNSYSTDLLPFAYPYPIQLLTAASTRGHPTLHTNYQEPDPDAAKLARLTHKIRVLKEKHEKARPASSSPRIHTPHHLTRTRSRRLGPGVEVEGAVCKEVPRLGKWIV